MITALILTSIVIVLGCVIVYRERRAIRVAKILSDDAEQKARLKAETARRREVYDPIAAHARATTQPAPPRTKARKE